MQLVVRRSALRMWLFAILGVPFVIFGVDTLGGRRLTTRLTDLIYPGDNVVPPAIETHELAWAWAFLVAGGIFTVWALKELIAPRRVVTGDWRGVSVGLAGPFLPSTLVPWSLIDDIRSGTAGDGESEFPVLILDLRDRGDISERPWGARWVTQGRLAVASRDWEQNASKVAVALRQLAREVLAGEVALDRPDDEPVSRPMNSKDLAGWEILEIEPPTSGRSADRKPF